MTKGRRCPQVDSTPPFCKVGPSTDKGTPDRTEHAPFFPLEATPGPKLLARVDGLNARGTKAPAPSGPPLLFPRLGGGSERRRDPACNKTSSKSHKRPASCFILDRHSVSPPPSQLPFHEIIKSVSKSPVLGLAAAPAPTRNLPDAWVTSVFVLL